MPHNASFETTGYPLSPHPMFYVTVHVRTHPKDNIMKEKKYAGNNNNHAKVK